MNEAAWASKKPRRSGDWRIARGSGDRRSSTVVRSGTDIQDAGAARGAVRADRRLAGKLLGSPTLTTDIDICYARDDANLERLARTLQELHAHLGGAPADLPFRVDAMSLRAGDHFTLTTDAGDLDLLGTPAGITSFDALERAASPLDLDGLVIRVAAIDDLIAMKRAAGRPKDLIELEVLGALREEMDEQRRR